MFTLYEAVPQMANAFYYTHDLPTTTAVETLTKSGLFTEVTQENDVITLNRDGSIYKLNRGTVVVLQDTDSFSLVDDITFFSQYAELVTIEADEFQKLVERVDALDKAVKSATKKAPTKTEATKKVEKELDTPADTE